MGLTHLQPFPTCLTHTNGCASFCISEQNQTKPKQVDDREVCTEDKLAFVSHEKADVKLTAFLSRSQEIAKGEEGGDN